METYFIELIGKLIATASGLMLLVGIIITVLWAIMPVFVVMMNSKLKKINTNLAVIAEVWIPSDKVVTTESKEDDITAVAEYDTDGKHVGFTLVVDE